MSEIYVIHSFPAPTAAVGVALATGTSIISLLQVKLGATLTQRAEVVEWGISFDKAADAAKIPVELISTMAVAATVTAHVAAGIINLDPHAEAPADNLPFDFGTAATGYNASAEGTITATRPLDGGFMSPAGLFVKQFPLGERPQFDADEFLRIRVHTPATVNARCYMHIRI